MCVRGDEYVLYMLSPDNAAGDLLAAGDSLVSESDADDPSDGTLLPPPPPPRRAKVLAYTALLCDALGAPLPAPGGNEVEVTDPAKVAGAR